MSENKILEVIGGLYGGQFATTDPNVTLPFVLRKEKVEVSPDGQLVRILEPAIERTTPLCPHFSTCGGCQYQMIEPHAQTDVKRNALWLELEKCSVVPPVEIPAHYAEAYGYRNRIRLRVQRVEGVPRLGYNIRATTDFLPITTCPIAAPILWSTAERILARAEQDRDVAYWLSATTEIELFCNHDQSQVQLTLFCAPRTKSPPRSQPGHFTAAFNALRASVPQVAGAAAEASDPRTGPTGRTLAAAGASGLAYRVADIDYWITRGAFFQTNRFLIETLADLVTTNRAGALAWDLYAGVGLFSRILARSFAQVVAVEASPLAAADLRAALAKLSSTHTAIESTTLAFLERAITQRERPDLIVLDPPRAGAGVEACALLNRLAPRDIVYVSCDPTTLARDLAVLQLHYRITQLHLVDLFPQTFHLETIAILHRKG